MAKISIAILISKANLLINRARELREASLLTEQLLAGLPAEEQRRLKRAAEELRDVLKFFNDLPFDNTRKKAAKVFDKLPAAATTNANDFKDALVELKKLFNEADDETIVDLSGQTTVGEGNEEGGGGSGEVEKPGEKQKGNLQELFENVSNSLLDAQTALNKKSLDYVANLDPTIPPAYYGIPSVRAEMHVGFSEIKAKGVNFILFNSSTQKQQFAESTVTFEIVGAPPPPGPTLYGEYVVPIPRLIVVGEKRKEVLDEVAKRLAGLKRFENARADAAVLRYEEPPTPVITSPPTPKVIARYLVLWPGYNDGGTLATWQNIAAARVVEREQDGTIRFEFDQTMFNPPQEVFKATKAEAGNIGEAAVGALSVIGGWVAAMKVKKPR